MRIALWDIDPFNASKERLSASGWDVRFVSPADCGRVLLEGEVDAALVPTIEVLKSTSAFTILPGVAFASKRRFPYVGLLLNRPVMEVRTILASRDAEPFYGLASVVLREQYESRTTLVRGEEGDGELVFGSLGSDLDPEHCLDVGLEWFELTGTPMTWGFFAVRPGTVPDSAMSGIQEELAAALRDLSGASNSGGEEASNVNLRVSYDPEVSEGIDEMAHYLFYVGVLDDIPALRLMSTQT